MVGVVKNTVRSQWVGPAEEEAFVPMLKNPLYLNSPGEAYGYLTLVVRATGDPAAIAPKSMRRFILDKHVPISEVQTMER